jgi:hypothetical protein
MIVRRQTEKGRRRKEKKGICSAYMYVFENYKINHINRRIGEEKTIKTTIRFF